jgi:hypothetical protein
MMILGAQSKATGPFAIAGLTSHRTAQLSKERDVIQSISALSARCGHLATAMAYAPSENFPLPDNSPSARMNDPTGDDRQTGARAPQCGVFAERKAIGLRRRR